MKKSTRIITICSIILSIFLLVGCSLIVFITQNNKTNEAKQEVTNYSINNYKFFNDTKINTGNKINLANYFDKQQTVYDLTDYLSQYNFQNIKFDQKRIFKNVLPLVQLTISKLPAFHKIEQYYIKIKFEIINNYLVLDVRWANKQDILLKTKTALYWDQLKLTI